MRKINLHFNLNHYIFQALLGAMGQATKRVLAINGNSVFSDDEDIWIYFFPDDFAIETVQSAKNCIVLTALQTFGNSPEVSSVL